MVLRENTGRKNSVVSTFVQAADNCLRRGWVPIPTCWPNPDGSCGCGRGHIGHDIGKAPLVKWSGLTLQDARNKYLEWAKRWPWANVDILVEESGLIFVGPDSEEARHDWRAKGLPPTTIRFSHNAGYFFKRPEVCALARSCKPEYGDIISRGLVCVSGTHSLGDEIYTTDDEPTEAPSWVVDLLASKKAEPIERPVIEGGDAEPPVRLVTDEGKGLWNGSLVVDKDGKVVLARSADIDRSSTLFRIGAVLAEAGAMRSTIASALTERDLTLDYGKYSDRKEEGESEYLRIADKVVNACDEVRSPSTAKQNARPALPEESRTDTDGDAAPWPDPLDPAARHGLAGEFVGMVEPHSEADPVAIIVQFLVHYGNVIGHSAYHPVEASKHSANENVLIVGPTAKARKGTGGDVARRCIEKVDTVWATERVVSGLSSGEGLIWAVRDPIVTREPIKKAGRVIDFQEVETDPGVTDKRLLVLESEFASPLAVMNRAGNTLSPVIREAWDNGNLRILTKNNPAVATNAHISIIGHITKDELLKKMAENELGNGFANRFLFVASKRSKYLPEGGQLGTVDFSSFEKRLKEAVEFAKTATEMRRDRRARSLWAHVYPKLSEGGSGLLGSVTARAEAHVLRLSMIIALLDRSQAIRVEHLLAALAVWDYCFASARWLFGTLIGDQVADRILDALKHAPDGMAREEFIHLFDRNKSARQIGQALSRLQSTGTIAKEMVQGGRGRPAEVWRISSFPSFSSSGVRTSFCAMARKWLAQQPQELDLETSDEAEGYEGNELNEEMVFGEESLEDEESLDLNDREDLDFEEGEI